MAAEVEDDAFFADLSRQIALLIMDDEEEFPVQSPPPPVQEEPPFVPQMTTMEMTMMMPPHYGHEGSYRRESKGTGVFIPRSATPRRKSKPRRPHSSSAGNCKSIVASRENENAHAHSADVPRQLLHSNRRPSHVLKRHM